MKNTQQNFKNIQISEKYSTKKRRRFLYIALIALAVFIFIYTTLQLFNTKNAEINNLNKQINELKLDIKTIKENKEQIAINSTTSSSNIFEIKNLLEAHNLYNHFSFSKLPPAELEAFLNKHQNQLNENKNSFFIESENNNYFLTADRKNLYQLFLAEEDKLALEKFNINILSAPLITDKIIENIPQLFEEMKEKTFNRAPHENSQQQPTPILLDNSLLSPNTAYENNFIHEDNTVNENNFIYEDNAVNKNNTISENNNVNSNNEIKYSQPEISKKPKENSIVNLPGIFLENYPEETEISDTNHKNIITSDEGVTIEDLEALPINNSNLTQSPENEQNLPSVNVDKQELDKPENNFYQDTDGTWRNSNE